MASVPDLRSEPDVPLVINVETGLRVVFPHEVRFLAPSEKYELAEVPVQYPNPICVGPARSALDDLQRRLQAIADGERPEKKKKAAS